MRAIGILLAAGNSSRFGSNKLACTLSGGESIGVKSARNLVSVVDECIAVVRQQDTQFRQKLIALGFNTVIQPKPELGMGSSLALAIEASADADGWLITLADMPWIHPETYRRVYSSLQKGSSITAPVYNGRRGHPVGFNRRYRQQLLSLHGDVGARSLLVAEAELIQLVEVDDPGILYDVDRREDLEPFNR